MKVCLVRLLGLTLVASALAALVAFCPQTPSGGREIAVVHLHPSALHSTATQPAILPRSAPETAPGPAAVPPHLQMRPLFHPNGPLVRPILPWWLHRRHLAAPLSSIA